MAHSSLLGSDEVPVMPPGHDTASLGPSDSSDSGSDMAGVAGHDESDPGLPVDVATGEDRERPETNFESVHPGADSDAGGTGERRSAGGDAGPREAPDIGPDDIVPRPGSDVDIDDKSPIFEDYPAVDSDEDLPEDEDSESTDDGNAVFSAEGEKKPAHRRKTPAG